jgi:hypothetical protein
VISRTHAQARPGEYLGKTLGDFKSHTHTPRSQALPITALGHSPKKAQGRVSCFFVYCTFVAASAGLGPFGVG